MPSSHDPSLEERKGGLAQPFLILILEGAPLLSRLLRQGGDFDLHELRMPSQVPRPVPARNAGTRTGQPLDFIRKDAALSLRSRMRLVVDVHHVLD